MYGSFDQIRVVDVEKITLPFLSKARPFSLYLIPVDPESTVQTAIVMAKSTGSKNEVKEFPIGVNMYGPELLTEIPLVGNETLLDNYTAYAGYGI